MEKQHLFFDLDGTLTDPKEGITKSVRHALNSFGISADNLDELCPFIGPPLKESFMEFYGLSDLQAEKAIDVFREYFSERGIYENEEYAGVREMLASLKEAGKKLYVATSKPELFAKKILKYFSMEEFFTYVGGADFDETRVQKADVIRYVMEENGLLGVTSQIVMIGDRSHDVRGAQKNGIDSIGVLYGYGSRQELEMAGAGKFAGNVEELCQLLLPV